VVGLPRKDNSPADGAELSVGRGWGCPASHDCTRVSTWAPATRSAASAAAARPGSPLPRPLSRLTGWVEVGWDGVGSVAGPDLVDEPLGVPGRRAMTSQWAHQR